MKTKIALVAALVAGLPAIAGAFTLDAVGYDGSVLSLNPISIFVPGYGNLTLEAAPGSSLPVNSAFINDNGFGGPSLNFTQNEAVRVTFNGLPPLNVNFDFVGVSAGENFKIEQDLLNPRSFLLTLQGPGDGTGAGLYAISWNAEAIPEPTSAMLGLVGGALFAFRRRR